MTNFVNGTAYMRYSDKKQDGKHSFEIQMKQIQLLAERENIIIQEWRSDKATSAFHSNIVKRNGIQLILEDIKNGAQAVCFYEESRITRSITDFYNDIYVPIKTQYPNLKFYSTQSDGEWNPDDPLVQAKLVFAAEEAEIKSVRAKDAQVTLLDFEQPKRPGSRIPVGYDMINGVLHPNEDSPIVEFIFYLASFGHSHKAIAHYLNRCEIKTKSRGTSDNLDERKETNRIFHWNSSTIGYILNNKVYGGNLAWNVRTSYENSKPKQEEAIDLFKQVHDPIVSPVVYHLVKQVNDFKDNYGIMNTPYYLRGIIKCKKCQSKLIAKDNSPKGKRGQYMIYRCTACKKNVSIIPVHDSVLADLLKKWGTQLHVIATSSKEQLRSWSNKLNKSKVKIQQNLEMTLYNEKMLADEIASKPLLSETFKVAQQHLHSEISYINRTIEEIESLLADNYLSSFLSGMLQTSFLSFTDTELRVFFLMFFEEVLVDFNKSNEIQISYRLSPFVLLKSATGYLTEQV